MATQMRLIIAGLLLACSALASAKTDPAIERRYSKAYDACINNGEAAQGVQYAMNECAALEYDRQDARLNQAYVMVIGRLNAASKAKLRTSQRAWIKTRDQTCKAETAEYEGGSIAPLIYSSCMTYETIRRTIWLEKYH